MTLPFKWIFVQWKLSKLFFLKILTYEKIFWIFSRASHFSYPTIFYLILIFREVLQFYGKLEKDIILQLVCLTAEYIKFKRSPSLVTLKGIWICSTNWFHEKVEICKWSQRRKRRYVSCLTYGYFVDKCLKTCHIPVIWKLLTANNTQT